MLIIIEEPKRRRWTFRRRRFSLHLPESWEQLTLPQRQRWWRWLMTLPRQAAVRAMVRDLLPRWVRASISDLDFAGLTTLLDWVQAEHDCSQIAIPSFQHQGVTYHFATAKGESVSCIEYALADDYYKDFSEGNESALLRLVATIWREADMDEARALRRDDKRVPLYSKSEVEKRAKALQSAPMEIHLQALLFFGGLKAYIYRVYGKWLFEEPDDPEDDADTATEQPPPSAPDFGWWGIFQRLAESGTYGVKDQVLQESIHEVCINLVRKQVESNSQPKAPEPDKTDDDDL